MKTITPLIIGAALFTTVWAQETPLQNPESPNPATAQTQDSLKSTPLTQGLFVGYELGEMAFNGFQIFSSEIGKDFGKSSLVRFVYQNVKLSEAHLSSDFAQNVSGDHIKGQMVTYELFYDHKIRWGLTLGASAGYTKDVYEHTQNQQRLIHESPTLGFAFGYRENNLWTIPGLYMHLAVPFRYYFDPLPETKLGESTVNEHLFVNNIWLMLGYQF